MRAGYGRIEVLHGISLEVPKGSALALLGPNGAGKTTLLKAISGQLAADRGHASRCSGTPLGRNATEHLARSGLCMIPEGRSIFPNLTVAENLLMYTYRRPGLKSAGSRSGPSSASRDWAAGASSWPAPSRVVSSGCSPWPGP